MREAITLKANDGNMVMLQDDIFFGFAFCLVRVFNTKHSLEGFPQRRIRVWKSVTLGGLSRQKARRTSLAIWLNDQKQAMLVFKGPAQKVAAAALSASSLSLVSPDLPHQNPDK